MLFTTDKQTLEDLNIFGKHGGNALFNIYNRCITRGGASIMEEMFRYPLSDERAINQRIGIIKYFAASEKEFPFNATHFDAAETYLNNTDERTRLSSGDQTLTRKLGNMIAVDVETQIIHKGVQAVTEILKTVGGFVATLHTPFYQAEKEAVVDMVSEPGLLPVLNSSIRLSQPDMVQFDTLLRFRYRDSIRKLLRHIYFLDVYMAVAKVAVAHNFVFPEAMSNSNYLVKLNGVYHPQVKNAVPNTIHISPEGNVIFLTGANMAGKSTFMKSLSIALYTAHMGFPVAAKQMEFVVLDGIYTTINLPDNLGMGASHFYAEVLRVKKIAHELSQNKKLFIVFDELFRGTNVKDAYEATIAITTAFASRKNSLFVISTHIIEAGEVLKERCANVRFLYLPTRMNGSQPVYTYTLEEGITNDRHGMIIISNEGILNILEAGLKQRSVV
ncbi:DNA mismatch repair protein [Niastella yeongjuensis]|uniref:DNA mismatch repair protein n=1 Tax=Niastella yeongjuensis TaxID=354355 RepID=A0A1V9EEG2_9BACT|nr:adenylyl-sulfate kinase [Niastella yeongjuensis]OQP44513.1 DNA mismatch repair protein [Niastella yeongjuensis]SEO85086.1 MutS domain III [Niastella yeongjuensis]